MLKHQNYITKKLMENKQREYLEIKLFKQHKNKTRFYLMGRDIYKKYVDWQEYLKTIKK